MAPDEADDGDEPAVPVANSGQYLLGLAVVIDPDPPLLFQVDVAVEGALASFDFQPLKTDSLAPPPTDTGGARPDARTPTGDAIRSTVVATGAQEFELGLSIRIPGDANPITFRDIEVDLTLSGILRSDSEFCGTITGAVTDPIALDVSGSTFGAIRTEAAGEVSDVPVSCPTD